MDVSLTTFLDFAMATGGRKVTVVHEAQTRPEYHPAFDFYKPLRDGVVELHRLGRSKSWLDRLMAAARPNQRRPFEECVSGYRRWLGRKEFVWLPPVWGRWEHAGLGVRVNPELHLVIDGSPFAMKLYWKDGKPDKRHLDPVLFLMENVLASETEAMVGVLDVRNAKLHTPTVRKKNVEVLLRAEARAFVSMWHDMEAA